MSSDTDPQAIFDALAAELLATSPTTRSTMSRMPCLKNSSGKVFAGFRTGRMVFKLPPLQLAAALALPGADLFDPSERGRPWKEWVQVPAQHASQWLDLALVASRYSEASHE